jgi:hypothetical protein
MRRADAEKAAALARQEMFHANNLALAPDEFLKSMGLKAGQITDIRKAAETKAKPNDGVVPKAKPRKFLFPEFPQKVRLHFFGIMRHLIEQE